MEKKVFAVRPETREAAPPHNSQPTAPVPKCARSNGARIATPLSASPRRSVQPHTGRACGLPPRGVQASSWARTPCAGGGLSLAAARRPPAFSPSLPHAAQWQLNAYTNWNLIFIMLRLALKQKQWDPFLAVNSVGILVGFRTAMAQADTNAVGERARRARPVPTRMPVAQGIDENMRTKIRHLGLPLSRRTFVCLDHLLHTVPPALLVSHLVRRRKRVPLLNIVYVSRACAERSEGGKGLNVAYGHR